MFTLFLFCVFICQADVPSSIIPLDEIEPGMKGKGRSVFKENKIEEFDIEILGILRNVEPKRSIIISRIESDILDKAGVTQGMSGSPVYIDGKLIGAIAYGFPYAKEAIAGITPIEEMLDISREKKSESSFSTQIPIKKHLSLEELFELNEGHFLSSIYSHSDNQTLAPLSIPIVFGGFSSRAFNKIKPIFSKMGFNPIRTGFSNESQEELSPPDIKLQAGDSVGVQLVKGDLSVGAVGTVTFVDGNRILAFGHPIFNLGDVDFAMTSSKVITTVPSLSNSFKIATTDYLIGRFAQDRNSGVSGELGKIPDFIPLNIKLKDASGKEEQFKVEIVNDKILSPAYVNMSLMSIISAEQRSFGDLSLNINGNIYLENGRQIPIEDFYSGNYDTSVNEVSNLVAALVYFLKNNEFKNLGIFRIDLSIKAVEEARFAYLDNVWLDKYEASPGERIKIKIFFRTFHGKNYVKEVGIYTPHLPPGSTFQIVVADAASIQRIDMARYMSQGFTPRDLDQLIRILGHLRKNNRIYFKLISPKPGLFMKGEEMPNLPPTMKSMFVSSRTQVSSPRELNRSTLGEYQMSIPYVFQGAVIVPVSIKK